MATFQITLLLKIIKCSFKIITLVQIPLIILELMISTASSCKKNYFTLGFLNKYKCIICCMALDTTQVSCIFNYMYDNFFLINLLDILYFLGVINLFLRKNCIYSKKGLK